MESPRSPASLEAPVSSGLDTAHHEPGFGEAPPRVDVLLLYESLPSGKRAKQALDRLVDHVNLIVSFRLSLCRFDLLAGPEIHCGPEPLLDPEILVVAAGGQHDLPPAVWAWVERWLACDLAQPRALVMSLEEGARVRPVAQQIHFFLQAAACRAGVEFFSHFGETRGVELDSEIAGIRYRVETTSSLMEDTLRQNGSASFRFWGIND